MKRLYEVTCFYDKNVAIDTRKQTSHKNRQRHRYTYQQGIDSGRNQENYTCRSNPELLLLQRAFFEATQD